MHIARKFFEGCYPRLVRFLYAQVGDLDQAEDLAQEAFVRLLEHRPEHPQAWLFRVAENLVRDDARLASGRTRHLTMIQAAQREERDAGPEAEMLRSENAARVARVLAALPERDRTLLLLHNEGFRYREIAAQLDVAASSVGPLLTRAQRRFLQLFDSSGERRARQTSS